jgi:hypothetical protein
MVRDEASRAVLRQMIQETCEAANDDPGTQTDAAEMGAVAGHDDR